MRRMHSLCIAACIAVAPSLAADLKAGPETVAKGFVFPESVGCDPAGKYIYVGNFGGTELKPGEKDGKGYISRATADGKVVDERFLPAQGETMNKPKGIWVTATRLWVTDIDGVWIFDLKTRKSRKLMLPGVTFANDPALVGNERNKLIIPPAATAPAPM